MARPRGGDWLHDEVAAWKAAGINAVVDLLTVDERNDLGLRDEPEVCRRFGIDHISFPIADRGVPDDRSAASHLVRDVLRRIGNRQNIGIHCRAGIGRSALIAACVLVEYGRTPEDAFDAIAKVRGVSVPDTDAQRDWVRAP